MSILNKSLLLSIGIPTYNRPEMVLGQVEELISFVENNKFTNLIELIIVDNNSDYDFFELLRPYKDLKFVKIFRNASNIGMARNIIRTIEESAGEYYFFIGDDDRIDFDGFKKIISLLSEKRECAPLIVARNPVVSANEYFFYELAQNEVRKYDASLDRLQFYYIGNACSFVKLDLCKEFVSENMEVAASLAVPQAMCVAYAVMKNGEMVKANYPILRKTSGDEFVNNVVSSWSILYTRVVLPWEAMAKISSIFSIKLTKKNLFYRQPEIRPSNFIVLVRSILMLNWYIDSPSVRSNFGLKLRTSGGIPAIYKIILKFLTSSIVRFSAKSLLHFLCILGVPFAIRVKLKTDKKIAKKLKDKNNKSVHSWEMGDL